MISELALIQRVQLHEDRHAFTQLVKAHQSQVRFTLLQLTHGNDALADDLAQETFLKAYQGIARFNQQAAFATWLHRIAYNCFISHVRKSGPSDETAVAEGGYEVDFHHSLLQSAVNKALLTLPVEQRAALHYGFQRGHSHGEIAQIMGVPLGTVKTLINRGKIALQQTLAGWQESNHAR